MRTKVTLVLIFLNAALFVFIFKFERGWRTDQAQREARRRVLGPETASIQQLRISGPSLTTIELVRSGAQWSLTSPIDWPANPHAVNRILNELQFLEHETSFSVAELEKNKQSLADYGLEPPRLTIEFTPASTPISSIPATHTEPQRITLQVGDETKVGNRLYLLSPQRDRVHVVGLSLARSLNLPLEELRTDDVFSIPLFEARSLTLQNASASRVRIRQDGKHWSFEAPIIARANKPQVELTIAALNALRVHHFLPTGTASPSTPTTNAELRISLVGNNRQETLILLNEIEAAAPTAASEAEARTVSFVAALEGKTTRFVVEVPQPLLNTLRNAQDTLREPRILDFAPEALTAVTLSAPNQAPLTLQQLRSSADGQHTWQIIRSNTAQGPQLQPVDPQRMRELIQTLRRLSAQRFVSDAPSDADLENWGFNRPERKITLTLNPPANSLNTERESALGPVAEPQTLHLQIGRPTEPSPQVYARLSNARFVYAIPAELLEQTAPDPLNYRQHLLRELPETARFHSLTLTDLNRTMKLQRLKRPLKATARLRLRANVLASSPHCADSKRRASSKTTSRKPFSPPEPSAPGVGGSILPCDSPVDTATSKAKQAAYSSPNDSVATSNSRAHPSSASSSQLTKPSSTRFGHSLTASAALRKRLQPSRLLRAKLTL